MKMKCKSALLGNFLGITVGLATMSAVSEIPLVQTADFTFGTPIEWTVEGGEYRSPEYSNAVDRIELCYTGITASASATIYAKAHDDTGSEIATFNANTSAASFDFPDTTAFRSFRIAAASDLTLLSFTAYVSAATLAVPTDVVISNNVTGTSFDAYWNPVEGATGYKVYVWTNAVAGASAGTALWEETFANSPAKSSSTAFSVSYTDSGESAWTFDKVYAHSEAAMVRIGNTSAKGVLVSPALGDAVAISEQLVLRVHAWKQESKDGDFMPIGIVSGDVTNVVEVLEITTTPTEYYIALPSLSATDRISFHSPTNKSSARAILDDVAIVSGYSEGHEEPAYIVDGLDVGAVTSHSFTDLPSLPVFFAVDAYGRRGAVSPKTDAVQVDLAHPDQVAALNACPVSYLTSSAHIYTYSQNFDPLATITATTGEKPWLNGTTLQYWQAYKNSDAATTFNYNGGAGTIGGLYVLSGNRSDTVRALGAYSTKDNEYSFGIAFTNDTENTMLLSSIEYSAHQWGFANTTNQTLSVSVMVTNRLNWISSYAEGWTDLGSTQSVVYGEGVAHDTPVSTPVSINNFVDEIAIAPGQVLMIKWTVHSLTSGKPSMMAIDDVSVSFSQQPSPPGTVIRIVNNAH